MEKAHAHYLETENWRLENQSEETYQNLDRAIFNRAQLQYGIWNGRRDRQGRPTLILEIRKLGTSEFAGYKRDAADFKSSHPYHCNRPATPTAILISNLMEYFVRFTLPVCNAIGNRPDPQTLVTSGTNIVDMSGVSIRQWWLLKDHLAEASTLITKYFPGTLDLSIVVGVPPFFTLILGAVQKWFNPSTLKNMIFVQNHEMPAKLLEYVDVDDLPVKFGGNLKWKYGDEPIPDDEVRAVLETDGRKGWIGGPCIFKDGVRVTVGTEKGEKR